MSKKVILCVDDEPIILESLQDELEEEMGSEYQIELAENGDDALALLEELQREDYQIALVIADYVMPGIRGDELLTRIHEINPNILKIMLTGQSTVEGLGNAVNHADLFRYMTKPWKRLDLIWTVKDALQNFNRREEMSDIQEALRQSELLFRSLSASAPIGIALVDSNCHCYYVNKRWEIITSLNREFHQGPGWLKTLPSRLAESLDQFWREKLINCEEFSEEFQLELPNHQHRWVELHCSLFSPDSNPIIEYVVTLNDITERKQAMHNLQQSKVLLERLVEERSAALKVSNEELNSTLDHLHQTQNQLVVHEKLASLGKMTAGISHEIKNPLNFVNNFSEVALGILEELGDELTTEKLDLAGSKIEEHLNMLSQTLGAINTHGIRANKIVQSMLLHSHQRDGERQSVNFHNLLKQYLEIATHSYHNNPDFCLIEEWDLDEAVQDITLVPEDIGRVFLNVFSNALYAMLAKSKQNANYKPKLKIRTKALRNHISTFIWDNGSGISEDHMDRLFEPFFTTKPPGSGTGLGLSLSYEIVTHGHRGTMQVNSTPNKYTEFIITLPN